MSFFGDHKATKGAKKWEAEQRKQNTRSKDPDVHLSSKPPRKSMRLVAAGSRHPPPLEYLHHNMLYTKEEHRLAKGYADRVARKTAGKRRTRRRGAATESWYYHNAAQQRVKKAAEAATSARHAYNMAVYGISEPTDDEIAFAPGGAGFQELAAKYPGEGGEAGGGHFFPAAGGDSGTPAPPHPVAHPGGDTRTTPAHIMEMQHKALAAGAENLRRARAGPEPVTEAERQRTLRAAAAMKRRTGRANKIPPTDTPTHAEFLAMQHKAFAAGAENLRRARSKPAVTSSKSKQKQSKKGMTRQEHLAAVREANEALRVQGLLARGIDPNAAAMTPTAVGVKAASPIKLRYILDKKRMKLKDTKYTDLLTGKQVSGLELRKQGINPVFATFDIRDPQVQRQLDAQKVTFLGSLGLALKGAALGGVAVARVCGDGVRRLVDAAGVARGKRAEAAEARALAAASASDNQACLPLARRTLTAARTRRRPGPRKPSKQTRKKVVRRKRAPAGHRLGDRSGLAPVKGAVMRSYPKLVRQTAKRATPSRGTRSKSKATKGRSSKAKGRTKSKGTTFLDLRHWIPKRGGRKTRRRRRRRRRTRRY